MPNDSVETRYRKRFGLDESRFGLQRRAVDRLPVIDISALTSEGSPAARQTAAREIRSACINSGFFYISDFGIPADEFDRIADVMKRFFTLPQAVKDSVLCRDYADRRGYQPVFSEAITPGYQADYKEYYDMGLDEMRDGVPEPDRGITLWPGDDVLPGFKADMQAHVQTMTGLAQKLARGFALSLKLDEGHFDASFQIPHLNLRTNYYPPAADVLTADQWSCGPHCDYMAFTMLWQDENGGLEVMNLDGDWIEATPIQGTMVVNIGDMMSNWTNDLYTSNPHRVANKTSRERLSLPTFVGPDSNTVVECLPTCMSPENPPRYPPIVNGQHVSNILASTWNPEIMQNVELRDTETTQRFRDTQRIGAQ